MKETETLLLRITAWVQDTYKDTATATTASDDSITISDTSWLRIGTAIKVSGTVISAPATAGGNGFEVGTTYYVNKIILTLNLQLQKLETIPTAMAVDDDTGRNDCNA